MYAYSRDPASPFQLGNFRRFMTPLDYAVAALFLRSRSPSVRFDVDCSCARFSAGDRTNVKSNSDGDHNPTVPR